MPAKKPQPKKANKSVDLSLQLGICQEPFNAPLFDEDLLENEGWGDLGEAIKTVMTDVGLYEDCDQPVCKYFGDHVKEWMRMTDIFSPFKPLLVKNVAESDLPRLEGTDTEVNQVARRKLEPLKDCGPRTGPNAIELSRLPGKRKEQEPTPDFMGAFHAAVMVAAEQQKHIPKDAYLWELLWPKQCVNGIKYPVYNPSGKYAVKLWWAGGWRKIVIDDRLPVDSQGRCLFPFTTAKEVWPALLAKAMLKILTPLNEHHLFQDPHWCLQCLMGGWVPEKFSLADNATLALRLLRNRNKSRSQFPQSQSPGPLNSLSPDLQLSADKRRRSAYQKSSDPSFAAPKPKTEKPGRASRPLPEATDAVGAEPEFICASPGNNLIANYPQTKAEYERVGLEMKSMYLILESRPFENTTFLRLMCPHVRFKAPSKREAQAALDSMLPDRPANCWNQFWIRWEHFQKYFGEIHVYRWIMSPQFQRCQTWTQAEVEASFTSPADPELGDPALCTKFLFVETPVPTKILLCLTGMKIRQNDILVEVAEDSKTKRRTSGANKKMGPESVKSSAPASSLGDGLNLPLEPEEDLSLFTMPLSERQPFRLEISSYVWNASVPIKSIATFTAFPSITNSFLLPVAAGANAYVVRWNAIPPESVFAVMSGEELSWSEELDLCTSNLGLSVWVDGADFGESLPNQLNISFKRHLFFSSPMNLHISLSVVPDNYDRTKLMSMQTSPAERKKQTKGPNPDKPSQRIFFVPSTSELPEEVVEQRRYEMDLLSYTELLLVNCDTGQRVYGSGGRIPVTSLEASKLGYMLIASTTAPRYHPAGLFKLQMVSDTPLDKVEPRSFDTFVIKEGDYQQNMQRQMFQYNLMSQETAYQSLVIQAASDCVTACYSVTIDRGSDVVFEQHHVYGTCYIPNLWVYAYEPKSGQNKYTIRCHLEKVTDQEFREYKRIQATEAFRASSHSLSPSPENMSLLSSLPDLCELRQPDFSISDADLNGFSDSSIREATPPMLAAQAKKTVIVREAAKAFKVDKSKGKKGSRKLSDVPKNNTQQSWYPAPTNGQVVWCLKVYSSSAKIQLEVDNTVEESVAERKQQWAQLEEVPPVHHTGKGRSDLKAQAAHLEAIEKHHLRAKQSRENFLMHFMQNGNVVYPVGAFRQTPDLLEPAALSPGAVNIKKGLKPPSILTDDIKEDLENFSRKRIQDSTATLTHQKYLQAQETADLASYVQSRNKQMESLAKLRTHLMMGTRSKRDDFWTLKREEQENVAAPKPPLRPHSAVMDLLAVETHGRKTSALPKTPSADGPYKNKKGKA